MNTKAIKSYVVVAVCLAGIVAARGQHARQAKTETDRLSIAEVRNYRQMFRVNKEPIDMAKETRVLCAPATLQYGPHYDPGVVYYINEVTREGLKKYPYEKLFPVGSIIVKEKQEQRTEDSVQIITVMKKVLSGNAEDSWEYKMYDTKRWVEIDPSEQEKKKSAVSGISFERKTCLDCHRRYKENDYVSAEGQALLLRRPW